jgi:hypothetical protein
VVLISVSGIILYYGLTSRKSQRTFVGVKLDLIFIAVAKEYIQHIHFRIQLVLNMVAFLVHTVLNNQTVRRKTVTKLSDI